MGPQCSSDWNGEAQKRSNFDRISRAGGAGRRESRNSEGLSHPLQLDGVAVFSRGSGITLVRICRHCPASSCLRTAAGNLTHPREFTSYKTKRPHQPQPRKPLLIAYLLTRCVPRLRIEESTKLPQSHLFPAATPGVPKRLLEPSCWSENRVQEVLASLRLCPDGNERRW